MARFPAVQRQQTDGGQHFNDNERGSFSIEYVELSEEDELILCEFYEETANRSVDPDN